MSLVACAGEGHLLGIGHSVAELQETSCLSARIADLSRRPNRSVPKGLIMSDQAWTNVFGAAVQDRRLRAGIIRADSGISAEHEYSEGTAYG